MIDINELRRLTQAATPGPWKVGQYLGSPRQFVIHMDVGDKGRGSDVAFTSANFGNDETIANARLIAAANPTAISELLDRLEAAESEALEEARLNGMGSEREAALLSKLEAAEKERDELRTELNEIRYGVAVAHDTIKALRAKIEAMEKQKPVASVWRCDNDHIHGSCERTLPMGTKLYALPGAKGEEK